MQRLRQTSGERNFCANTRESGELIHITCICDDVVNASQDKSGKEVYPYHGEKATPHGLLDIAPRLGATNNCQTSEIG
jgi:hypothetical protein